MKVVYWLTAFFFLTGWVVAEDAVAGALLALLAFGALYAIRWVLVQTFGHDYKQR